MALYQDTEIQYLKGVGPKLGDVFRKRGIVTVSDLLNWFPRTYEDRRAARSISSLVPDEIVSLEAMVVSVNAIPMGRTRRRMYQVVVSDSTGKITCNYFRMPYKGYFSRFQPHQKVRITGKVTLYRGKIQFHHPDIHTDSPDEEQSDRLIPIYTETDGLSPMKLRKIIEQAIRRLIDHPEEPKYKTDDTVMGLPEHLPTRLLEKYDLLRRDVAIKQIHNPPVNQADQFLNFIAPAQKRIIFDEFFWLELHLALRKTQNTLEKGHAFSSPSKRLPEFLNLLPFELTNAQKRSFKEIVQDLKKPSPMHRLVQGDVGSGKTMVALMSALYAVDNGFQAAIMAPTEILAEQHYKNAVKLLEPMGIRVSLLKGHLKASDKEQVYQSLATGETHICVGTHALVQEAVEFKKLGLVIIDEQHRFGVDQRNKLKQKGVSPHFLVMTATPIPRSLAMTVYGDLDVSLIDEMPPGRSPVVTRQTTEAKRPKVLGFLKDQILKGRQAYVVYPLVEESENLELKNAVDEFEKLQKTFPEFKCGLLHGKMKPAEKDEVMTRFRNNEIQILVSTTVIEVGVDVPNANLMIIEHAERFGLSQLHQLRGRVGRGEHKSYCVLILGYAVSEEGKQRAQIMERTTNGFKIAESDLEMRGPGEFLGKRQSGLPGFKMANLVRDISVLQLARQAAFEVAQNDPDLKFEENKLLKKELEQFQANTVG